MDYTVHGILQVRIMEEAAFPSPEDLPNPGIKPRSPASQADSLSSEPRAKMGVIAQPLGQSDLVSHSD